MNGFCERFEIRRFPALLMALLAWIILHFVLILQFNNQYWSDSLPLRLAPLVAAAVALCCSAEFLLFSLLAGSAKKSLRARGAALFVALLLLSPIYLYFLAILVSWSLFSLGTGFLDSEMLRAFFVNTQSVWKHFSQRELLIAVSCLLLPVLPASLFLLCSPAPDTSGSRSGRFAGLVLSAAAAVFLLRFVPTGFSEAEQRAFRRTIGAELLPNLGLLWSGLLPSLREVPVPDFSAELTPLYSLQDYAGRTRTTQARPDIILIIVEALRTDMVTEDVDGRPVMPVLRALAREGALIEDVLAPSAESAYSMTSILTGLYPMKFGVRDTFVNLRYPHTRVYDVLAAGGYRAGFFSSANEHWQNMSNILQSERLSIFFHSESDPAAAVVDASGDDGFPRALREGQLKTGKLDDAVTIRRLIDWLKQEEGDRAQPLFATVSLQSSHFPYQQGVSIPEIFTPSALSSAEKNSMSFLAYAQELAPKMKNRYRNSLRYMDGLIGELSAYLQSSPRLRDAVLVVSGDHGELFHEHGLVTHGSALFNTALAVPVVIHQRGKQFKIKEQQQRLLDLAPTIVDIAGLPPHANFQGRSMLQDPTQPPVFASMEGLSMQDAVIFRGMKLMYDRRKESYRLFDLRTDPQEVKELPHDDSSSFLCLKKLLENFRARQLAYYGKYDLYSRFFPPPQDAAPEACL